jgi:hypothetical protein
MSGICVDLALGAGEQEGLTLENARKLARALGITIDMLAGKGEDESNRVPGVLALAGTE